MISRIDNNFNQEYGENKNLRQSKLLIELNKIIFNHHMNLQSFCAETLLSEKAYRNITGYKSENYELKTLAAIFIAVGLSLNKAEELFHMAGYHLNDTPFHNVIRFSLENNLSIYDADALLYQVTNKHFIKINVNNSHTFKAASGRLFN